MKYIRYALWAVVAAAFIGFIVLNLPTKKEQDHGAGYMPPAGFNKGEHFSLIDHKGAVYDSREQIAEGNYALIFFGFTHCPVICPTELQKFAAVMDLLPPETADKITPIFITIDPERDSVDVMSAYVPMFHENIVGLTGDVERVHATLDAWKVFYTKVEDPQFTDYTMDHSTYAYLVDHDMNFKALFRMKNTADEIADSITKIVQ